MKVCPYCAEEIQDAAVKCKHCGEFLDGSTARGSTQPVLKWYFHKTFLILILASIGPLGLPLIWWHPTLSRFWKIGISIGMCLLTWLTITASIESYKTLKSSYSEVQDMLNL